jgi:hypothetical protein
MINDKTISETAELIDKFKDVEIIESVNDAKLNDPVQQMRTDMMSFFSGRIKSIKENKEFKDKVKEALLQRIEAGKDVTFSDLKSLFAMLYEQGTLENDSVLSLLRPAGPNATNPLLSAVLARKEDGESDGTAPTNFPVMDKVYRLLLKMEQEEASKEK